MSGPREGLMFSKCFSKIYITYAIKEQIVMFNQAVCYDYQQKVQEGKVDVDQTQLLI